VPIAHVDTVKRNLRFNGTVTEEKDLKGAALIFVFIGAVLLPYLADAVLALRREMVHGGLIIDTGDRSAGATRASVAHLATVAPQDRKSYSPIDAGSGMRDYARAQ
jgi:hypothetical protein